MVSLFVFYQDLRLRDNPALTAATRRGEPLLCLYVDDESNPWAPGGNQRWWLNGSLDQLQGELGPQLVVRRGPWADTVLRVAKQIGADQLYFHQAVEPYMANAQERVAKAIASQIHYPQLVPLDLVNKSGQPFQVFSAYWRAAQAHIETRTPLRWATPAPSAD